MKSIVFSAFFLIIYLIDDSIQQNDCQVVINEVNTDNNDRPETVEFIELKLYCLSVNVSKSLDGYKLILIDFEKDKPIITLAIDLMGESFDETNLFTIGGTQVKNANIKEPDPRIQFRKQLISQYWTNFLTNGDFTPKAVVLLYSIEGLPNLALNTITPYIIIEAYWTQRLQKTIKDIVVYARRALYNKCYILSKRDLN